ncbi:MAG: response regulator transcription factor [Bacteroidota bacterium]
MDAQTHLLLVDDDLTLSDMTREYLEAKGYQVSLHHSADDGLESFKSNRFDLCILDVKMPIRDGFSLAEDIRQLDSFIPLIFLTGQNKKEHRIKGLTIGADDYVTKPFSMEELHLRIQAILKRVQQQQVRKKTANFQIGQFQFDANSRELIGPDATTKLSAIESKLLTLFCEHLNELVGRDIALHQIWGHESYYKGRSLNVYVSKIRGYLKADPAIEVLNVHGEGYRMVVK